MPSTNIIQSSRKTAISSVLILLMTGVLSSCGNPSSPPPKPKQAQINENVILKSDLPDKSVYISNEYAKRLDKNIVAVVKGGTRAKILEIRKESITPDFEMIMFRVKTSSSPVVEGWVYSFDAGYSTKK